MKRGIQSRRDSFKNSPLTRRSALLMLAVIPAAALSAQRASAATDTWTGGTGTNWATANNWSGNIAPQAGDSLIFTGANTTASNNFTAGTRFGSITFDPSASAFTLSGNAFVLGDNPFPYPFTSNPDAYAVDTSAYYSLTNNSTSLQTVTAPITLSTLDTANATGGFHIINGGTAGLAINGSFTRPLSATADFQGAVTSTTIANNPSTGIIGGWATYTNGSAVDFAAMNGTTVGAYGNYVQATATIASAANSVVELNAPAGVTLTAAATTDIDSLNFVNTDSAVHTITLTTGQELRMGVTGAIMRSDNTTVVANSLTIAGGCITAGGPITGTPGELILNANGNAGNVASVGNNNTILISSSIVDNGTGGTVSLVKTGIASVQLSGNNSFTGNIYLDDGRLRSSGNLSAFGLAQNIYISNGSQLYPGVAGTYTANIFLAGIGEEENSAFIGGAIRLSTANITLAGTLTLTDNAMITGRGSGTTGSTISGKITGAYTLRLGGGGNGTIIVSNTNNNWSGGLQLFSGVMKLGANEVIPNGVGFGDVSMFGDQSGTQTTSLDLNAHTETINGLNGVAGFPAGSPGNSIPFITNTGAGNATLTIGDNNASGNFTGNITDAGAGKSLTITKIGTGTQILGGNGNNTGNVNINGGILSIMNSSGALGGSTINVGASGKLDVSSFGGGFQLGSNNPQTLVNSGTVLGDFSVNSGSTVSGTSPYGNVTLAGGNVSPGASAAAGVVGTTTFGNLTVNSGNLVLDLTGAGDKMSVTNTLNLNGSLSLFVDPNPTSGTYTIITAGTINNVNNIATPANSGRTSYTLDESVANIVKLIVSGNPANLTWDNSLGGGDGSSWDFSTLNWKSTALTNPYQYFDGDNVTFNDTHSGTTSYTVSINATVSPGSITVNNSAGDYVFNGSSINGIGSLTKSGTRALTINTSNSYSGGTILNNGTLNIGNASALGTGTFTINGGTIDNTSGGGFTLANNNALILAGNFTFTGAADSSHDINFGTGAVSMNGNSTITVAGAGSTLTIGGPINGGSALGKAGPGTLILSSSTSGYTGGGTYSGGTVRAAAGALGTGTINVNGNTSLILGGSQTSPLVMGNSTLAFSAASTLSGNLTITPGSTVNIDSFDPAVPGTSINESFTGSLNGSGNIILVPSTNNIAVDGNQAFRINGANTGNFSGNITIDNNSKAELFATTAGFNSPAGTATIYQTAGDVALGATGNAATGTGGFTELNLRNNLNSNVTFPNNLVIIGTGYAILNPLGSATTGCTVTMGGLTIGDAAGDAQTLGTYLSSTSDHPVIFPNVSIAGANVTFDSKVNGYGNATAASQDLILGNVSQVSAGTGFSVNGLGTVFLTGTSTFTGAVNIQQGTLGLQSNGGLNATNHVTLNFGSAANGTNGTLDLGGFTGTVGGLNINAGANPSSQIIGSSSTTSPSTLNFVTGTSTFAGTIQDVVGAGNQTVGVTVSSGSLDLTAADTYTGPTSVTGGTLTIDTTGSITSSNISTSPGGSFTVLAGGSIPLTASLTNNGTTNFNNPSRSIASLSSTTGGTVNLNTTVLTITTGGNYTGVIQDSGTGGGVIVPVASNFTAGPVNTHSLEVDGKMAFQNTTIRTLSKIGGLTIAGTYGGSATAASAWSGSLDLTSSRLIVEDSSGSRAADLAELKDLALASNTTGNVGIYSSTALLANAMAGRTDQVVAVVDNAVRIATFPTGSTNFGSGTNNVDASSILITATYLGDANLDGQVNILDLQDLANHWQQNVTDWSQGDFNGDGIVNILDLQALANHWQFGVGTGNGSGQSLDVGSIASSLGGSSSAPEPASLALLGIGGAILGTRRRRK